jgi:hypothetical protein
LSTDRLEYTLSSDLSTNGSRVVESTLDSIPTEILRFEIVPLCYRGTRLSSLYPGVTWSSKNDQ